MKLKNIMTIFIISVLMLTAAVPQTFVYGAEDAWLMDESGKTYYINGDGEKMTGYQTIDGREYFFADNGTMKTGWKDLDGIRAFFSHETGERLYGWIKENGYTYYCDENGKAVGQYQINGKNYFFDSYGILVNGWFENGGYKYYSDMQSGIYTGERKIDGTTYLFSENGKYKSCWQTVNGKRIFYDPDIPSVKYGMIFYNGYIYYSDEITGKYTGEKVIDNCIYRFSDKGVMQLGFQKFYDGVRYYGNDGKTAVGWNDIGGKRYYFKKNGVMLTGWQKIDGSKYCFDRDGAMLTGWQETGGKRYYLGKNGTALTGWQEISGKKYYFDKDGAVITGWQTLNGKKYFFETDGALRPNYPKVFVGVGHGGYDSGAVGYIVEKEYTFKTAQAVARELKAAGIEFMLSRDADINTTMESKLKLCNDYDPDLIIDIHYNAVGPGGFEVYHSMYGGMSKTLAENINAEVSKFMGGRGCQVFIRDGKDRFTIIRETHAPSVLLEGGYVDVKSDAEFIKNNYEKLAKAYVRGVLRTLELIVNARSA